MVVKAVSCKGVYNIKNQRSPSTNLYIQAISLQCYVHISILNPNIEDMSDNVYSTDMFTLPISLYSIIIIRSIFAYHQSSTFYSSRTPDSISLFINDIHHVKLEHLAL